jgi:hypothetical protein
MFCLRQGYPIKTTLKIKENVWKQQIRKKKLQNSFQFKKYIYCIITLRETVLNNSRIDEGTRWESVTLPECCMYRRMLSVT